jgi:hypothetical protein
MAFLHFFRYNMMPFKANFPWRNRREIGHRPQQETVNCVLNFPISTNYYTAITPINSYAQAGSRNRFTLSCMTLED